MPLHPFFASKGRLDAPGTLLGLHRRADGVRWNRGYQKAGRFEPAKFEDQYEAALVDLINKKRAGQPLAKKDRPAGANVVDLMEALRRTAELTKQAPDRLFLPVLRKNEMAVNDVQF